MGKKKRSTTLDSQDWPPTHPASTAVQMPVSVPSTPCEKHSGGGSRDALQGRAATVAWEAQGEVEGRTGS